MELIRRDGRSADEVIAELRVAFAAAAPAGPVLGSCADAESVQEVIDWLGRAVEGVDDAGRVDLIGALEAVKGAAEATQARVSVALAESIETDRAAAGVPAAKRSVGIGAQVALARRESPWRGSRHLGLSRALVGEMPATLAALQSGVISAWAATLVVRATACLSAEHRGLVDARIGPRLGELSEKALEALARSLAYELDPAGFVDRARRAVSERRVSVRPAPDAMAYLTALLPVGEAVGCYAALKKAAQTTLGTGTDAVAPGEGPRSLDQIMADELVARITGVNPATHGLPVEVHVVMDEDTLFHGGTASGRVPHAGPVPATLARLLARTGSTRPAAEDASTASASGTGSGFSPGEKAWVRRLFTHPGDGSVTGRDARRRFFTGSLRGVIIARDQTCRTPWCDAPIRHVDHVTRYTDHEDTADPVMGSQGGPGPTSVGNGAGLCEACNYTKEAPGWAARAEISDDGVQTIHLSTPTGHTYTSRPPPAVETLTGPAPPGRDSPANSPPACTDWPDTG